MFKRMFLTLSRLSPATFTGSIKNFTSTETCTQIPHTLFTQLIINKQFSVSFSFYTNKCVFVEKSTSEGRISRQGGGGGRGFSGKSKKPNPEVGLSSKRRKMASFGVSFDFSDSIDVHVLIFARVLKVSVETLN